MSLKLISGTVTGYRERVDVEADQHAARTTRTASFRIGSRSAFMNVVPSLVDGDPVAAAGKETGGEFRVIAVRNDTTNVYDYEGYLPMWAIGVLIAGPFEMLLLCLMDRSAGLICAFLFGPFLTIAGIYQFFKGIPVKAAIGMVTAAPKNTPGS